MATSGGSGGTLEHAAHDHSSHAGHDHSDHSSGAAGAGGMDMGKYMSGVERLPDGRYFYSHGAFTGHVVPGAFFLFWGLWWTVTTYTHYVQCLAARRPFRTRGWRLLPFGPRRLRALPLEPFVKILLPAMGMLGELWLGHDSFRHLYDASTGKFYTDNINDWQHSTMYLCFLASGVVDLLGHYCGAPLGADLAFLALSFLSEGLLLVFHLKGPRVEILVHLILGLQVFATVVATLVEMAVPSSILAASVRPWLTMLQGTWWIVTAYIMYTSAPQWDPDYMGSGMMVPVPFVAWSLGIAFAMFCLLLAIKAIAERRLGRPLSFDPEGRGEAVHLHHPEHRLLRPAEDEEEAEAEAGLGGAGTGAAGAGRANGGGHHFRDVELSGGLLKTYAVGHSGHAV